MAQHSLNKCSDTRVERQNVTAVRALNIQCSELRVDQLIADTYIVAETFQISKKKMLVFSV